MCWFAIILQKNILSEILSAILEIIATSCNKQSLKQMTMAIFRPRMKFRKFLHGLFIFVSVKLGTTRTCNGLRNINNYKKICFRWNILKTDFFFFLSLEIFKKKKRRKCHFSVHFIKFNNKLQILILLFRF
jgi:hypothetical protein